MRILTTVVVFAMGVAIGVTGCQRSGTPTPGGTAGPTATPTPTASATDAPATWSSQPQTVTHNVAVPPVPRLTAIRSAQHTADGYDRVVFDFVSTLPGYDIRYVDTVIADGSGLPVTVPGQRWLRIVFRPAQAHDDAGGQVARSATLDLPMLKAYAITGDFEGVLTVVLGLGGPAGYRVTELPGTPGRISIDVAS
jgi:hypothetical protein